jgi:hypothetical protein
MGGVCPFLGHPIGVFGLAPKADCFTFAGVERVFRIAECRDEIRRKLSEKARNGLDGSSEARISPQLTGVNPLQAMDEFSKDR